ncbi:MAG: mycothiol synthase [Actinomycetota bacterium]
MSDRADQAAETAPTPRPGGEELPSIDLLIIDRATPRDGRPGDDWLRDRLQRLLDDALPPALRDDRFDGWTAPADLILALALDGDRPIGYLGGAVDRGRVQLDGLLAADRAEGIEGAVLAAALYRAVEPSLTTADAATVELWGRPAAGWHRALADRNGFDDHRALHQMRCGLPIDADPVPSRPFVPGQDEHRLLTVNNRAFADHPDQGGMTIDDLRAASTRPWFDPDGIRLHDDPDDPDRLAGFCWTKIHQPLADDQPALGEIYAIGVDPDHHGKGLGVPMTAAGLTWLAGQGLTTGMLYVEADNHPAIRTYEKLGFDRHRTDRAWSKRLSGGGDGR